MHVGKKGKHVTMSEGKRLNKNKYIYVNDTTLTTKHPKQFESLQWTDCIIEKIFENIRIVKFITTALKSVLKLVKLQSLVAKYCKMQKLQACKIRQFCILLYYARKTDTNIEKTVSTFPT